jgi:hypothetical protein
VKTICTRSHVTSYWIIGSAELLCGQNGLKTLAEAHIRFPDDTEIQDAVDRAMAMDQPVRLTQAQLRPHVARENVHGPKHFKQRMMERQVTPFANEMTCFCCWLSNQPGQKILCTDMSRFYMEYPQCRDGIGKLKDFCRESQNVLIYEVSGKKAFVALDFEAFLMYEVHGISPNLTMRKRR